MWISKRDYDRLVDGAARNAMAAIELSQIKTVTENIGRDYQSLRVDVDTLPGVAILNWQALCAYLNNDTVRREDKFAAERDKLQDRIAELELALGVEKRKVERLIQSTEDNP